MRGVHLTGHGGPERLQYRNDLPTPQPGPGDVLIRVAAAGVNNTDINTRTGWYAKSPGAYDSAVSALRHMIANGLRTAVSFTAQRRNYKSFPAVARLATDLGVWRVWSDRLIPAGQGEEMRADMLTPEETRESVREHIDRLADGSYVMCSSHSIVLMSR